MITAAEASGQWSVAWRVTASSGVPEEVFLYNSQTSTFARICRVYDLSFPTTRQPVSYGYWRTSELRLYYDTIADAVAGRTEVNAALAALVESQDAAASFVGTTATTYEAP